MRLHPEAAQTTYLWRSLQDRAVSHMGPYRYETAGVAGGSGHSSLHTGCLTCWPLGPLVTVKVYPSGDWTTRAPSGCCC